MPFPAATVPPSLSNSGCHLTTPATSLHRPYPSCTNTIDGICVLEDWNLQECGAGIGYG
ncbi:hypothetical protein RchiOBHm_Chr4g0421991 [Rosa chinensis]|uniref:Uncharacterized protein n=1 Tax=Rosa chinensis TaxID=74649 RepID=A0A2P6QYA6_ROSCH|nr:hypothetical protein RchiOBHm_Chr4g0421991 [Rosa chinensis]